MIGLGKLGVPVSVAMVQKGHEVYGYDVDVNKMAAYRAGVCDLYEPNIGPKLRWALGHGFHVMSSVKGAVEPAEIVFVAVPTPSLPDDSFDTGYVEQAVYEIAEAMVDCLDYKVVAIISTVLPGTVRRAFLPILAEALGEPGPQTFGLAYNAQFIAMGTTIRDMLEPEFVLIGQYDDLSGDKLGAFYSQLTDAPLLRMSLESAEMVKMSYNTMIGFKIVYANTIMEMCDKVPHADCETVTGALCLATRRLLSCRYLRGGMGDGGGCHIRDNRALSYLARGLELSADPFDFVIAARDLQTEYVASIVDDAACKTGLPIAILGRTFKPETNLETDSPALLLGQFLACMGHSLRWHDPITMPVELPDEPHVYVVATAHRAYLDFPYARDSIIIDPWRIVPDTYGCVVNRIGGKKATAWHWG